MDGQRMMQFQQPKRQYVTTEPFCDTFMAVFTVSLPIYIEISCLHIFHAMASVAPGVLSVLA
jgi:hypothetical protein